MTTNRLTLEQALKMDGKALADATRDLPPDQLHALLEDLAGMKAQTGKATSLVFGLLDARYARAAADERRKAGKDTGGVMFADADFLVSADLPKKVEWDQPLLRAAVRTLTKEWGETAEEYVTVNIVVSETKFNAWPKKIKMLFEPARTVSAGKPTYKMERT